MSFQSSRWQSLEVDRGGILNIVTRSVLLQRVSSGDSIFIIQKCQTSAQYKQFSPNTQKCRPLMRILGFTFVWSNSLIQSRVCTFYKQYLLLLLPKEIDMQSDEREEAAMDFFDSPEPIFDFREQDRSCSDLAVPGEQSLEGVIWALKPDVPKCKTSKLNKQAKIRTSKNVQKTYHNILRQWLEGHRYEPILAKYHKYFNQRVYFILVLDEINKHISGPAFLEVYTGMANEVIRCKMEQATALEKVKSKNQQSLHLARVVEEIKYSIKACQEFTEGRVHEALVTVYKRDQKKICKMGQFKKAVDIFTQVTGYPPQDYN